MSRPQLILILIFLAGLIILLLPDNNDPMIRLNKMHGPSLLDLIGLVLMISAWLASCIFVIKKWALIIRSTGRNIVYMVILIYLLSLSAVFFALLLSLDLLLWVGITIAVITNLSVIITAIRIKE